MRLEITNRFLSSKSVNLGCKTLPTAVRGKKATVLLRSGLMSSHKDWQGAVLVMGSAELIRFQPPGAGTKQHKLLGQLCHLKQNFVLLCFSGTRVLQPHGFWGGHGGTPGAAGTDTQGQTEAFLLSLGNPSRSNALLPG